MEGVYGIIEVKSTLSKSEFVDAAKKIEAFKKLAPVICPLSRPAIT